MSIFEAIGMLWVVMTSALATIAIFYLAFKGARSFMKRNASSEWFENLERTTK